MKIGKMRSKVQFQRRMADQQNPSTGSNEPMWITYESTFAQVQGTQGKETLEGTNKLNAEVTHKIWVRWHEGFNPQPQDRILNGDRVFEIDYVVNMNETDRTYIIGCFEDYNQ